MQVYYYSMQLVVKALCCLRVYQCVELSSYKEDRTQCHADMHRVFRMVHRLLSVLYVRDKCLSVG